MITNLQQLFLDDIDAAFRSPLLLALPPLQPL
jgi:hypothetical protein